MCDCCGGGWVEELAQAERTQPRPDPGKEEKQGAEEPEKKVEPVPPR